MDASNESWETKRKRIFEAYLSCQYLPDNQICNHCSKLLAVVKCNECSVLSNLCHLCDEHIHKQSRFCLHTRKAWHDGCFINLLPTEIVDADGKIKEGSEQTVIDLLYSSWLLCVSQIFDQYKV